MKQSQRPYSPKNMINIIRESGLIRKEFAAKHGITLRALHSYCLPFKSEGHRDISAEKWIEILNTIKVTTKS